MASGKEKFIGPPDRKFFAFQQRRPKMSWPEQLPLFLQASNIAGAYNEWQNRQADLAIRLYEKESLSSIGFWISRRKPTDFDQSPCLFDQWSFHSAIQPGVRGEVVLSCAAIIEGRRIAFILD